MVRAHAVYDNENLDKPFLLEYWWRWRGSLNGIECTHQ
jgi:hypothetical protein